MTMHRARVGVPTALRALEGGLVSAIALTVLCVGAVSLGGCDRRAPAPPPAAPAAIDPETAVRQATERLLDAWNRHDLAAWSALLTEDVWYAETDDVFYKRSKGREQVIGRFAFELRNSKLHWELKQVRLLPDGGVAVVLSQRKSTLPGADGQAAMSFDSDPSYARWRRDGGGWRLAFFTSHRGWALAEIKKDEAPPASLASASAAAAVGLPAAATPGAASTPAADQLTVASSTGDPPAYTRGWGEWSQGCVYCHGRPPLLPHSEPASRIVAVGAAQPDGAALRQAMSRPALGGPMNRPLADPELTDEQLETIRRYLVAVRDGELPATLEAPPNGTQAVTFRTLRHDRDPPVRIAELAVSTGWRIERSSRCRLGLALRGQQNCTLVVRRLAGTSTDGELRIRLATTPGLEPRARVLRLQAAS
jgi:ketosteroid isomerase-like protein